MKFISICLGFLAVMSLFKGDFQVFGGALMLIAVAWVIKKMLTVDCSCLFRE